MALENFREAQATYTDSGASEVLAAKPAIEKQIAMLPRAS